MKLSEIPPTNEAAGENIKRAHFQVAHWLTSLIGIPPDMNPLDYGYEFHSTATGSILVPQPLPPGTKDSPDFIREMIHCGCDASQCKGTNCKCSTIACTLFCKCEAGSTCLNPLTKHFQGIDESQTTEEINQSEANLIDHL